ncbi:hypothetical protein AQUCO_00500268v1 [Aquilegia coerulea]|uniref:Cytochrome P450 n=1 Tax=Aquilegia coerulea TaxID=218851 RepID=A0A2G5ER48_AQUCA|nr:hypothetical protein AQUCO_00500268v1 [Aquilegia coerulea]
MDLQQLTTFPFIFIFLLLSFMLVKQIKKSKSTHSSAPLPPGPSKLPLIGHLHHLIGGLPHHLFKDLAKKHGPIMYLKLGQIPAVVISSPSVAEEMMKTHDLNFADRPLNLATQIFTYNCKDVVMAPYGEYWRQLRKICVSELLSAKRAQSFWSVREEEVSSLIGTISLLAGSHINLSERILLLINDIVARAAFGKTCKDKEAFISIMKEGISFASGFTIADFYPSLKFLEVVSGARPKIEKMHQKIDKILNHIIREHKENRMAIGGQVEEDLVDVLLRIQEGGELEFPITLDNVKAVILDMFSAGSETSATTIEWAFSELLRNPRVMEKTQTEVRRIFNGKQKIDQADMIELNYLRLVIKETLRLHPALPMLVPRQCRKRCELEGYEVPLGCQVLVNTWAMGRDPRNWKDPESFEPERFQDLSIDYIGTNFAYIPFGAGRRICPGMLFGIANVELPLALLLYHFDWKIANGIRPEELDMTEVFGAAVRRKENLYVIPTSYNPSS